MFLKRIEVKGFKSFADKVELELDRGITGVVGPNGSGKSNISDAVRWVLGEQSAKSLRGGRMEDVIFAGTDLRKPLGFAEVSITIDNSDGMLAIDYDDVTVTRRMYRSGESEYFINNTGCRLKDITELFMDTGVGKDGYSIIGQGRIEEILSAKAEDRREIFEEAAGIVKYKSRKQESEKKLDTTEQNIIRIDDIINELETQLGPLSQQSANARKYLDMRENLKVLELNLYLRNVDKIKEKCSSIDENHQALEDQLADNNKNSLMIEDKYCSLKENVQAQEEKIESIQGEVYSSNNEIEKLQGEINVLNEKSANININISRLDEEISKEKTVFEKFSRAVEEGNEVLVKTETHLREQLENLEKKDYEFQEVNNSISEKAEYIENLKSEVIELLNLASDKKSSINSLTAFRNNIEKRRNQIFSEKSEKEQTRAELVKSLAQLDNDIRLCKDEYNSAVKSLNLLEGQKNNVLKEKQNTENTIYGLNDKIQSKQARYRMLHEMENEFEGYNRSVKEIMKLKNSGPAPIPGICGVIADLIHVPKKLEAALEVALGAALQNIVTEDEDGAKKSIEFLKANKLGRATFLPLTTIKAREAASRSNQIRQSRGFLGFANELISYDKKYYNIISSLLGRVIIVDSLDNGISIAKAIDYSMKIVTLEGDVINSGGAFTGGSISQKTGSILSRKREIEELQKDLRELQKQLECANEEKRNIESRQYELETKIKDTVELRHSKEIALSSLNTKLDQAKSEEDRIKSELSMLGKELYQLEIEHTEICKKIEDETAALKELEERNITLTLSVQNEQSSIKDISDYKENLISEITALKVRVAEYRQEASSYQSRIDEYNDKLLECKEIIEGKTAQKRSLTESLKNLSSDKELTERKVKEVSESIEGKKEQLKRLYTEKKENTVLLDDMETMKKQYSETSSILQGEIHKVEMQKAKLDMELEAIHNKIWDDYEISYAAALKYKTEIDSISQAARTISDIKEEIKELGPVNVAAIEEYKKVSERYEFLQKQKTDLEEAKNSLKQVIVEMTEKMKDQFNKKFAVIKENFSAAFQQLFGGGRAELILCDQENILDSGIEIVAQPPGKRLQNLSLLSGGEKALTAIALLFGILKMKPSPFCILDEIEAALDDVNVARYSRFLKEFSMKTQFIIVTHRKGTMEVSDALYGVTMEEKGISRIVSVKLSDKAS